MVSSNGLTPDESSVEKRCHWCRLVGVRFGSRHEQAREGQACGKYYDLGISLQPSRSYPSPTNSNNQNAVLGEQRQAAPIIRWTTSPAVPPSPEEGLKRPASLGAPYVQPPASQTSSIERQFVEPLLSHSRSGSLTGLSIYKSASKSSI